MSVISKDVIARFQDGDRGSFQEIYDETAPFVYNVIRKMVKNPEEAEDLTHDVYIKIFDSRKKFNHLVAFTTWLYRIATNHTLNHIKRKKLFNSKLGQFFFNKKQYDEIKEETDDNHPIMKCLDDVKPDYRICLVLREIEEMSYDKIAETLNITLGTVKSRINRAKKELHAIYEKEGVNV